MKYLPTAFGQLAFAWKLYHYGLEGKIDADELDVEITFQDDGINFVVPKALEEENDLIIALENNLTIAFGAVAITLNRVREELDLKLPNPIETEEEQCIALIYQIRNAFAHDIAEPTWRINGRYRRAYQFGNLQIDLSDLDEQPFRYEHIGGPDRMFAIRDYFGRKFGAF